MKKTFTFLSACCFILSSAQAANNGICEVLPAGSPTYAFYEAQTNGNNPRPNNFTFTVPSASSRRLFVVFMEENNGNSGDWPTAISYGGQAMTETANSISLTNTTVPKFLNVRIFTLNEAGIVAATSNTFSVTYNQSSPANNASYAYTIFAVDEAQQTNPILLCGAQQSGGNLNRPDSLACDSPSTIPSGDLFFSAGAAGNANAGPLSSNYSTYLINQTSNGMVGAVFYHSMTATTTLTPFMITNGMNAQRFSMLSIRVPSSANPTITLPIQLETFAGIPQRAGNVINWAATEKDLEAYSLERSEDGQNYTVIGFVKAKTGGIYATHQEYSFTDPAPAAKSYYRLKIIENDGSSAYSKTISLSNNSFGNADNNIYPNPGNGTFTITNMEANAPIRVINAFGQAVGYDVINNDQTGHQMRIQLRQAAPGNYYISWTTEGNTRVAKVLVQ